ncbi:hypothetical protein BC829DRAFT_22872 [Chytridium lagenaria]|nr:hypothetical protein BC829DRAFT_22872 [Chytridium lagenaria]
MRTYFEGFGLFRLIFKSDVLAGDVKAAMRANSLLKAEYQMTYSVGKLNEGLFTLYDRTRAELQAIASESHPLSAYKLTKAFQSDVTRIISIINKQTPPSGVEVDPFTLRNLIATFDETNQADKLQESAEALVRRHLGLQVFILSGGVFATYLGVPWAISIPSTLIVSGAGIGLMTLNWRLVQDHFISRISEAQKKLQSKLLTTYDTDFKRVVAETVGGLVKLVEETLERRVAEGGESRKRTEELFGGCDKEGGGEETIELFIVFRRGGGFFVFTLVLVLFLFCFSLFLRNACILSPSTPLFILLWLFFDACPFFSLDCLGSFYHL